MDIFPALASFIIVGLAELGDKTQLLTIGFAAKYSFWPVALAIVLGSFLLNIIAAAFGHLAWFTAKPFYIQMAAGILFIIFGIWQLKPDKEEAEKKSKNIFSKMPVFWVVFFSFVLAEFGDKTQLTTLALAMKYKSLWEVGLGAGLGMALVNLFSIMVTKTIAKKVPHKVIHYLSAAMFIAFGVWTLIKLF